MFRSIYENRQRRLQLAATKFVENRIIPDAILFLLFTRLRMQHVSLLRIPFDSSSKAQSKVI